MWFLWFSTIILNKCGESTKRLQWQARGGENGQDVLVAREIVLLCCLSAQGKQFFIAVLTALVVTQSKSLFLTHLANGLTNFFILSHKEWCVYLKKKSLLCCVGFFLSCTLPWVNSRFQKQNKNNKKHPVFL